MEKSKVFTITEDRVEQWETEYTVEELKITGSELHGLIQKLSNEVWNLRAENATLRASLSEMMDIVKIGIANDAQRWLLDNGFDDKVVGKVTKSINGKGVVVDGDLVYVSCLMEYWAKTQGVKNTEHPGEPEKE
jgi:hypothetical protein